MKQLNIRIPKGMKEDLDTYCEQNNILISEYIIDLIGAELTKKGNVVVENESLIESKVELEQMLELVEGVHQSQLEIAKLLNHRNGEKDD